VLLCLDNKNKGGACLAAIAYPVLWLQTPAQDTEVRAIPPYRYGFSAARCPLDLHFVRMCQI